LRRVAGVHIFGHASAVRENGVTSGSKGDALAAWGGVLEEQGELARDERFRLCRARRAGDGASVLIKHPLGTLAVGATDRAALRREHELLLGLSSVDALARPRELWADAGRCALVLEDHGGQTLAETMRQGAPPLGWAIDYACQLAKLLAEVHLAGVVLRGLRPQAVLVEGPARRIRLVDLSDAVRVEVEPAPPLAPSLYGSRLAYAAPEVSGRVGRSCDWRSDFYSLGVLLYELFCGRLPFTAPDPMALIHAHAARLPQAPDELAPGLPAALSRIVMKLLAKAPEERYQSHRSLWHDLTRCRDEWSRLGRVQSFEIGTRDVPERFEVPRRLYGRDDERAALRAAIEHSCGGGPHLFLVSGAAGAGKTALVREVGEAAAREQALFVSGKFDQLSVDVPYLAVLQALRELVHRLLAEPEPLLAQRRDRIVQALGERVSNVAVLLPELALLLDAAQPLPLPEPAPPAEAANRLRLALESFIASQASAGQPLIVFLDDLQWADVASLSLIESMLASSALRHVLVVGAYRDSEVGTDHPLTRSVAALQRSGVTIDRLELQPLGRDALTRLAADALHSSAQDAAPLADLLLAKTAGNPFFTTQFLLALHRDGLIAFDAQRLRWSCALDRIAAAGITDNVADLMTRKIDRLSPRGQDLLQLAACIGHVFDAGTLAVVCELGLSAVLSTLWEAVRAGLLVAGAGNAFAFLHDRVQQAAYSRIEPQRRPQVHLSIGRLLWAQGRGTPAPANLLDIVSHLNLGASLIDAEAERLELAQLNLDAGRRAREASAFDAALSYFRAGLTLLDDPHWRSHHELAFALGLGAAECEYLGGDFEAAERLTDTLLARARGALEKAQVFSLRNVQAENQARYDEALRSAREGLALFDVALPHDEAEKSAALAGEIERIEALLAGRSIASLIDLPPMTDPGMRMVMSMLTDVWSPVYILGDATLARLISALLVRLSLQHGQCGESAYGYVTHAITLGPVHGDYASAYAFGTLALEVNRKFDDRRRRAKIHQQFHAHVALWCRPMHTCIEHAKLACSSGLASGDLLYAAYGASTESWPTFVSSQNLAECVRSLEPNLELLVRLRNVAFADALRLVMAWARALQGRTASPLALSHAEAGGFDEERYVQTYRDNPFFSMIHAIARLHLGCLLDEPASALAAVIAVRRSAHQLTGMIWSELFDFWGSLVLADELERVPDAPQRDDWLVQMHMARDALAELAQSCAENFRCHWLLLDAELERIEGRHDAALDRFEQAIAQADSADSVQQRALANERFARFWLGRGNRGIAALYLREALASYRAWGAAAKVRRLLEQHGDLLREGIGNPVLTLAESLDLASIVKAAHAVAECSDPAVVLERLLQIAVENAGARRGLVFEQDEQGQLVARAESRADAAAPPVPQDEPGAPARWPRAVVDYAWHTRAPLVLGDAAADERFAHHEDLAGRRPTSVLCLPIVHQGEVSALVYLENDLARDAFDPLRAQAIQILMTQGAVSLANARLAQRMRQAMSERERAEVTLRAVEAATAKVTGLDFFRALVSNLAQALQVRFAFAAEAMTGADGRPAARMRAFWKNDRFGTELEYEIAGTPCQEVLDGRVLYWADDVQAMYPSDSALSRWGARSYLGMPLLGTDGKVIGHIAILDPRPFADLQTARSVMGLCAGRAGAELERLHAAEGQQRALTEVQRLRDRLQDENVYLRRELIANVSHDLRSPLASLRGYLETVLLKEQALSEADRRGYLEIALRDARQMQALIDELFELVQLDFEGYRIEAEPVQLGELARDVTQKLGLEAERRRVRLDLDVDADLGLARADIWLVERALTNLLDNALAHTPPGGRIELSLRAQGAQVVLRVSDNGCGIAPEDLPHVFERFYRADKSRRRGANGAGLGLAIVKRIVELHGGRIAVDSAVGRGTSFDFALPLVDGV
jgi:predicted ATPase/signal transduction histidine kinase